MTTLESATVSRRLPSQGDALGWKKTLEFKVKSIPSGCAEKDNLDVATVAPDRLDMIHPYGALLPFLTTVVNDYAHMGSQQTVPFVIHKARVLLTVMTGKLLTD
jgi:hypothetical protein